MSNGDDRDNTAMMSMRIVEKLPLGRMFKWLLTSLLMACMVRSKTGLRMRLGIATSSMKMMKTATMLEKSMLVGVSSR